MPTSAELAKEYIRLRNERMELEKQADAKKKEELAAEERAVNQFFEDEISSMKVNGSTVYTRRDLFATCNDPSLLAVTEWSWLVEDRVNAQRLSAAVRERLENEQGDPELPRATLRHTRGLHNGNQEMAIGGEKGKLTATQLRNKEQRNKWQRNKQ